MRRLLPCLCLVLLCSSAAFAQNSAPKWDFTAGYVFNYLENPPPITGHRNLHGFSLAPAANFREHWAAEADFTYTRSISGSPRRSLLTYMAGLRYTWRKPDSNWQPYVHALVGGGQLSGFQTGAPGGRPGTTDGWAGKFGGGIDVVVGKHAAIRVIGLDYYRFHGHIPGGSQRLDNAAFTFGIRLF